METFTELSGSLLLFVYHCFDRIVIHEYLSGLSRPGQVVHFFQNVVGEPVIGKEVLSRRTNEYQGWVEAFAHNHAIAIEWAEPKVRKEDYVRSALRRMERAQRHGVYFILKSMEQGQTFRSTVPRFATADPNYRILARQRSRFTHYYFYIRDEQLGPMVMRAASFFPFQATYYLNGHSFIEKELNREKVSFRKNDNAFLSVSNPQALQAGADRFTSEVIRKRLDYWTLLLGPKFSKRERAAMNLRRFYAVSQIEYCRNFIFKRHFPIHKIFERSCEVGLWRLTANKIAEVFGRRITKRMKGKLGTVLEQVEHGHHIFRAYCRNAFVKQYEKFSNQAERSVRELNLLFMAEQQRISGLFVERHQRFFRSAWTASEKEFGQKLPSEPLGFGPHYRRRLMRLAQEISRRKVMPWLKPEQEEGERQYRTVALRFVEMGNNFLKKQADAGLGELTRMPHALDPEKGFRVRSRFTFEDFIGTAQPPSPLRWLADIVLPIVGARKAITNAAREFLQHLLEMNSSRVQNDVLNRI